MRALPVIGFLAGAFIFMNILGCGGTVRCRPAPATGMVRQAKPADCPTPTPSCEVQGDLVYNLGGGVAANSSAVALAGNAAPSRVRRYEAACEPCPPSAKPIAILPAAPAAAPAPAAYDCAARQCGESPYSRLVCESSEFMSACFTLSEEELKAGPEIYIPGVLSAEALSGATQVEAEPVARPATESVFEPLPEPVPEPADMTEEEAPAAPAAVAKPETTPEPRTAARAETAEAREAAAALVPLPAIDVYGNVLSIDAILSSIARLKTEQAKAVAEMSSDDEEEMTAGIPAALDPPVPSVTEIEIAEKQDVNATSGKTEQFPMVELPPKLD